MTPKKRILTRDAKTEIQRAWERWDGDKQGSMALDAFYVWPPWYRPYFLTFRGGSDKRLKVKVWLAEYEDGL